MKRRQFITSLASLALAPLVSLLPKQPQLSEREKLIAKLRQLMKNQKFTPPLTRPAKYTIWTTRKTLAEIERIYQIG